MATRPPPDPIYILRGANSPVTCLTFPDQDSLYSGTLDGDVLNWDLSSHRVKVVLDAHKDAGVLWVHVRSDKLMLLTQGRDGFVKTWHSQSGEWICTGHIRCSSVGFCGGDVVPDESNQLIAVPSELTSKVDIHNVQTKSCVTSLKPSGSQNTHGMCMSIKCVNSNQILTGYENGSILLWDLRSRQCIGTLDSEHTESVMCMGVSAATGRGLSGSVDSTLVSWNLDQESGIKKLSKIPITNPGVNDILVRRDNKICAAAGWDSNIRIFGMKKFQPLAVLSYHRQSAQCLAFSPDNLLACGSKDHLISLWDIYR